MFCIISLCNLNCIIRKLFGELLKSYLWRNSSLVTFLSSFVMFLQLHDSYFFPAILYNCDKNKRCHMSLLRFGHKYMVTIEAAIRRCSVERLFWKCSENSQENVGHGDLVYWSRLLKASLFYVLEDWGALRKAIYVFVTLVW